MKFAATGQLADLAHRRIVADGLAPIGLGIVNLDQLLNSVFGTLVSKEAPRAIDNAFRIYMLPQGLFSVAVATVLFPTLSRMAARREVTNMRRVIGLACARSTCS